MRRCSLNREVEREREKFSSLNRATAWVSRGFIIPILCDEEKKGGRERKKEKKQNRGGEEERKRRLIELCGDCVNEPVKGSHCLVATSIWYCTFLFLLHCLQPQCLFSTPLYFLSLKEKGGLGPMRGTACPDCQ